MFSKKLPELETEVHIIYQRGLRGSTLVDGRSWAAKAIPRKTSREPGRTYRIFLIWSSGTRPLHPHISHALDVGCTQEKGVTMVRQPSTSKDSCQVRGPSCEPFSRHCPSLREVPVSCACSPGWDPSIWGFLSILKEFCIAWCSSSVDSSCRGPSFPFPGHPTGEWESCQHPSCRYVLASGP